MSKRRHTGIESETFCQNLFHVLRANGIKIGVMGTLGDDDDRLALADFAMLSMTVNMTPTWKRKMLFTF